MSAPTRRELVRQMIERDEPASVAGVADMSASAYRHATRPDRNGELRQRILRSGTATPAPRPRMMHLKAAAGGVAVSYKNVERLYREAKL